MKVLISIKNLHIIFKIHPVKNDPYYLEILNKFMSWNIPDDESKTINGLALKIIDEIPVANLCIELDGYRFEIIKLKITQYQVLRLRALNLKKNFSQKRCQN